MSGKFPVSILKRGVAEIIVEEELVRQLESGKKLRLKMGFDPSRPDIHLGHVVGMRKLRQLQELGHQVVVIVGDWTAQIGDPSGMSQTRSMLSAEEVRANAETYMQQFFKVVDKEKTEVALAERMVRQVQPGRRHQAYQQIHRSPASGAGGLQQ